LTAVSLLEDEPSGRLALLGAGSLAELYLRTLQAGPARGRVSVLCSRTSGRAAALAARHGVPVWTTDLAAAVHHPDVEVVVVALPNALHEPAVALAAAAGRAVLCTKPLGRTAAEAQRMCELVERSRVFAGYLEDLCFLPRTAAAVAQVRSGALGAVRTARYRLAHSGPHSPWFSDPVTAGGGVLLDLGSHAVEVLRHHVGKADPPVAARCETRSVRCEQVEDAAVGRVRFASGAVGELDVSWLAGGLDLHEEVHGATGSLRLDHLQSASAADPPEPEPAALGVAPMLAEMLSAQAAGRAPLETFRDGLVVNAVLDACYASASSGAWEPVATYC
jgi:predicted dehydrogenase